MNKIPNKAETAAMIKQASGRDVTVLAVLDSGKITCRCVACGDRRVYLGLNHLITAARNPRIKIDHMLVCSPECAAEFDPK